MLSPGLFLECVFIAETMQPSEIAAETDGTSAAVSARQYRHLEVLVLCGIALVLPYFLGVGPGHLIHLKWWPDLPLPESCMSRQLFGLECPACGLTRSFIHLAHLRWQAAWEVHRMGALIYCAAIIQIPYRLPALLRGRETQVVPPAFAKSFGWMLIAALIVNWLVELAFAL